MDEMKFNSEECGSIEISVTNRGGIWLSQTGISIGPINAEDVRAIIKVLSMFGFDVLESEKKS